MSRRFRRHTMALALAALALPATALAQATDAARALAESVHCAGRRLA